jgi:hypothetical protein
MAPTTTDYLAKQSASLRGQMADYSHKMNVPVATEERAIDAAHNAFKQAGELCSYAESLVSRLVGGGEANDGYGEDQTIPHGVFPNLLSEALSVQRRMNEAMNSLRQLERQIP